MPEKPTYEELEQRIKVLEKAELELKRVKEILHNLEHSLNESQNLAKVGNWNWDVQEGEVVWSEGVYRIFGLDPDHFQPQIESIMKRFHPDDQSRHEKLISQSLENRESYSFEARILLPDGTIRNVLSTAKGQYDENGQLNRIIGVVQDITERKRAEEALRESEERLRASARIAKVGGWEIDLQGNTLAWTEETFRIHELDTCCPPSVAEAIQFYHPDDQAKVAAAVQRATEKSEAFDFEARVITAKKNQRWVRAIGNAVYHDGRLVGIRGMVQDITDRKRAEEVLRASETFLDSIIEHSPNAMWISDSQGTLIRLNQACRDLLRISDDEVVGKYNVLQDTIVAEQGHLPLVKQVFERGATAKFVIEYDSARLENIDLEEHASVVLDVTISPVLDPDGHVVHAIIQHLDITDRKRAEEALRESEERLQLVMEGSQLGYWDWNIETGKVSRNARWAEMLGYTLQEIEFTVKQWTDLHHPDDRAAVWKSIQDHLDGKTPAHRIEYRMRAKDGRYKWILDQARVVKRDAQGKPMRMSGTHTDITERKRAEEEREKLQAQLAQAQKMESVGRLAGGVAHDFNNMLGVILGRVEMILDQVGPDQPIYHDLQEIQKAARRSADIIRQLLAFARKQTVTPKVLDLNKTVEGMLRMLRRLIGEDIDLTWLPGRDLAQVRIDPSQIDQILANLCINARDAIAGTGKLTIETDSATFDEDYCTHHTGFVPGDYVLLAVSDNGCGMDQEALEHLFEPFFTTKEVDKGTGLGLATVYGIVKQNNGFVNVYSEPGQGTTFKLYLPRHLTEADPLPKKIKDHPAECGQETILLVEDEPAILSMTTRMLEGLGYQVMPARTPGEAIRLAQEYVGAIHLLMTDVVMPEMNGRDLAKNLMSLYPGIRRLFMSGYTANVIAHHNVLDEGVNFLQKPFSMNDLGAKVREVLDKYKV